MSILGRFFKGLVQPPAPQRAEPALPNALLKTLDDLKGRLFQMHQLEMFDFSMRIAAEVRALLADPRYGEPGRLERHGHKVWSQSDEDGILQEIFRRIGTASRSFVEFGVTDGRECNSLKLLVEGWRGMWMEAEASHCADIRRVFAAQIAAGSLELRETMVTAENADGLIAGAAACKAGELDLLSIDIDGNDYYVLKELRSLRPRVIVIEYNGKFPPPMDVVPRYEAAQAWDGSDYAGSSLQAIANLAARKGYRLVGTNITGVNAFFVREDLAGGHFAPPDAAALYNPARYWLTRSYTSGHYTGTRFDYASDASLSKPQE